MPGVEPLRKAGNQFYLLLARQHYQILPATVRIAGVERACARARRSIRRYVGELRFQRRAATGPSINGAQVNV